MRAPSASQKALSKSKGTFYEKMNVVNDTKTPEMAKSAKETGNICDHLWHLSRNGINTNIPQAKKPVLPFSSQCEGLFDHENRYL